jgi:hypothetical protein
MNRILIVLSSLLLSVIFIAPAHSQGYSGTDFWLCFPQNAMNESQTELQQSLFISSDTHASGYVETSIPNDGSHGKKAKPSRTEFTVEAGSSTAIPIDPDFEITSSGKLEAKAIHVTSDRPVSVFAISRRATPTGKMAAIEHTTAAKPTSTVADPSTESYEAIPSSGLGHDYMVLGYKSLFMSEGPTVTSQAEIIATEDNTIVKAKLTAPTVDGHKAGSTATYTMKRGEVLQLQGFVPSKKSKNVSQGEAGDLTGTSVTSNKPIAFFTGHRCALAPDDDGFCTLLVEQEPPTNDWGTDFIFSKFAGDGDMMRLVASSDSTRVTVNGHYMTTLRKGAYYEIDTFSSDAHIQASKPVLVGQYSTTSIRSESVANDPLMVFTTPTDRYITRATTVGLDRMFGGTGSWDHYLNIVVPDQALTSLQIDGGPHPECEVRHVGNMSIMTCTVGGGRHSVTCASPMAVYEYSVGTGNNGYDSYGHNCGIRLDGVK